MPTRFIFFDLGNVLLRFSTEKLARQAATVSGCDEETVLQAVYGDGMLRKVECGQIAEEEFYETFCRRIGKQPDPASLASALNDIFWVLEETQPLVARLVEENFPRGLLSNIGVTHWKYCTQKFPFILECFPTNHVLSYEVGAMKPEREIYQAAFEMAEKVVLGIQPGEIFFIDDMERNVEGAKKFGLDAVQYVSEAQLAEEIQRRGFNSIESNRPR